MYPRWDTYQFNFRLARYDLDRRHRQDQHRHVEVHRWRTVSASSVSNRGIETLNALLAHMNMWTHKSGTITHLDQIILARSPHRFNTRHHLRTEIGSPEHTMSAKELVPTVRLAILRSTLPH